MTTEKTTLRGYLLLFLTGIVQVVFVAINSYQIAHEKWTGSVVVAFLISAIWSWNVKKIAFGGWLDRLVYAAGASCGCLLGMLITKILYQL